MKKLVGLVIVGGWLAICGVGSAATLYSTRFEAAEGFDINLTLAGQQGWVSEGSGGNGLVNNFFENEGQQGFVGFDPPADAAVTNIFLWRPVNYVPHAATGMVVRFTTVMAILDSSANTNRDDFRWAVYNIGGDQLFSLNFDNASLLVSYSLDDERGLISTGMSFTNEVLYDVEITMNFAQNQWSATINGASVVNAQRITTTGAPLDLGDVDAVWAIHKPRAPGDNYMLFDNYQITTQSAAPLAPRLEILSRPVGGVVNLRLTGAAQQSYVIEATSDLRSWSPIRTNTGSFNFSDTVSGVAMRFYRARTN